MTVANLLAATFVRAVTISLISVRLFLVRDVPRLFPSIVVKGLRARYRGPPGVRVPT